MADLHIDDFYRDSALIMLHLYSHFPRKTILYVDDICGPDTPDEFGLHTERYQSCFSAMAWLAAQGYIQFHETIREEALDQAVLSQKGFVGQVTHPIVKPVTLVVLLAQPQGRRRHIQVDHTGGAAGASHDRKGATVGKQVQYPFASGMLAQPVPCRRHVQEKANILPLFQLQTKIEPE